MLLGHLLLQRKRSRFILFNYESAVKEGTDPLSADGLAQLANILLKELLILRAKTGASLIFRSP